jgi:D-amino-acid dehydrogenase
MTRYDAIVVGGGVVGASTAYHLVRAGVRTLLVDRRDAGRATDAGAGILSTATNTDDPDRSSASRRAPPRTIRS